MSTRRRTPYKPPRDRRELAVAILTATAIVLVTVVLVWLLRPNKDLGSSPPANLPAPTTLEPIDTTTAPATTAPAAP
jgi:hypothetical protein